MAFGVFPFGIKILIHSQRSLEILPCLLMSALLLEQRPQVTEADREIGMAGWIVRFGKQEFGDLQGSLEVSLSAIVVALHDEQAREIVQNRNVVRVALPEHLSREVGTSIAGTETDYVDIADFQATGPSGNAVTDPAGFSATIDWGDGSSSVGSIVDYPGYDGLFEINSEHAFPNPSNGEYDIQVEVTDPDGGVWYADPSTATVDPRPDELSANSIGTDTFSVNTGQRSRERSRPSS
jgi:hypothetical protein